MCVYAEYLLLENVIINYIILYATKKFARIETSKARMIISSIIGSIYCLVIFIPFFKIFTTFFIKLAVSVLMIIIAFNPVKLKKFMKLIVVFYIVTFVFAGASLAVFYLTNAKIYVGKGIFYIKEFPFKLLVISIVIACILIRAAIVHFKINFNKENIYVPITIVLNNKKTEVNALVDTGNSLNDPLTDMPVIIVQFSALEELLPKDIKDVFNECKSSNLEVISKLMTESVSEIKFRVIPYKSLGKENGMLLGFKPDEVIINVEQKRSIKEIIIGVYNKAFSDDEEYVALLHPEILN